ncbi:MULTISPECIES: hypothetical protein [Methylobacterium]|nr:MULTISPECIES: hypothetical protein [Methylobacterium]MCI9879530.1 hypothetical protein [Methylobacterium goesingense]
MTQTSPAREHIRSILLKLARLREAKRQPEAKRQRPDTNQPSRVAPGE